MIQTGDLWNCAYLVVNGVEIHDLKVTGNNVKRSVYFIFAGQKARNLNREFMAGKATANVTRLKTTMNHLKDLLFDKLRANNTAAESRRPEGNKTKNHFSAISARSALKKIRKENENDKHNKRDNGQSLTG